MLQESFGFPIPQPSNLWNADTLIRLKSAEIFLRCLQALQQSSRDYILELTLGKRDQSQDLDRAAESAIRWLNELGWQADLGGAFLQVYLSTRTEPGCSDLQPSAGNVLPLITPQSIGSESSSLSLRVLEITLLYARRLHSYFNGSNAVTVVHEGPAERFSEPQFWMAFRESAEQLKAAGWSIATTEFGWPAVRISAPVPIRPWAYGAGLLNPEP